MKNLIIIAVAAFIVYWVFFRKEKTQQTAYLPAEKTNPTKPFEQPRIRPVPKPVIDSQKISGILDISPA